MLSRLSTEEIEQILSETNPENPTERDDENGSFWDEWSEVEYREKWRSALPGYVDVPDLGRVTIEESFGGEGQGDEYWLVFKVTDGLTTRYFKLHGYYRSYDGGYYDGPFEEVKPVQRLKTYWE